VPKVKQVEGGRVSDRARLAGRSMDGGAQGGYALLTGGSRRKMDRYEATEDNGHEGRSGGEEKQSGTRCCFAGREVGGDEADWKDSPMAYVKKSVATSLVARCRWIPEVRYDGDWGWEGILSPVSG